MSVDKEDYMVRSATTKYREYKFRGKQKTFDVTRKGEWVYGYYVFHDGYDHIVRYENGNMREHVVERRSVGEWTGLKDSQGTDIYEGDVISVDAGAKFPVSFKNGYFGVQIDEQPAGTFLIQGFWAIADFTVEVKNVCRVVGNVFEKPDRTASPERARSVG